MLERKKRVVITGGKGFLGSHLTKKLQERGKYEVSPLGRGDYDLVDRGAVKSMFLDLQPDMVIHLAAKVGGIGANRRSPGSFFYENLMMGVQTMEEARAFGVEKFVAIGTICAYPKHSPIPFKEENLWKGYPEETNAPYGLAKKMLLVQARAYRKEFGFNAIYLLPVNLYGPGDNFDISSSHVIPAMIRKFKEAKDRGDEAVVLWGSGKATREFLYVKDCAQAITLAAENYSGEEPVNIGAGKEISIADLAEKIAGLLGFKGKILWDESKPDGQPRRCLDTERAEKYFGFKASMPFEEGLKGTIQWYLEGE